MGLADCNTTKKSVMDSIVGGKHFQFSKEMKISLAVDASVNWLEKPQQHRGLRERYQYFFRETLRAMNAVRFQGASF